MNKKEELRELLEKLISRRDMKSAVKDSTRVAEIFDTHDLVPIDAGEFRPEEDAGFEKRGTSWVLGAWELAREYGDHGDILLCETGTQDGKCYAGPWPSRGFAALLLRELGISK